MEKIFVNNRNVLLVLFLHKRKMELGFFLVRLYLRAFKHALFFLAAGSGVASQPGEAWDV